MSTASQIIAIIAENLADIAEVRIGLLAQETTSAAIPSLTLHSLQDIPKAETDGYGTARIYTRTVMIEGIVKAQKNYQFVLDDMLANIRQKIQPSFSSNFVNDIREIECTFFAPTDGSNVAILQLKIDFDYIQTL